jgi:ATP-dependent DNA helicase RecQ
LPALLCSGMAVVISPLISLMKDQVDGLNDMGISARSLNSSLSLDQQSAVIQDIRRKGVKLLYVSPERLQNEETLNLLQEGDVSFFVIDEAHCISHWGHDFRAEYRTLKMIKEIFPSRGVHAFTATATNEVQADIVTQLELSRPALHIGPVDRPTLTYRVMPRQQIMAQVSEVLTRHDNEAGIIYCLRRKDVDSMCRSLKELGFDNVAYHAGMSDAQRHENQERFMGEDVNIIVATVAFGMGVDRSNIRFVVTIISRRPAAPAGTVCRRFVICSTAARIISCGVISRENLPRPRRCCKSWEPCIIFALSRSAGIRCW